MRRLLVLGLVCALISVFGGSSAQANPAVVKMLNANVYIVGGSGDQAFTCSGTLIAPEEVLTAFHCIGNGKATVDSSERPPLALPLGLEVIASGGQVFAVDKVHGHRGYDLAILHLPRAVQYPAQVAQFDPNPLTAGDPIWVIGNPVGEGWVAFHGYVAKEAHDKFGEGGGCGTPVGQTGNEPHYALFLDARVWPGNSGGGLYDENGYLRGVVVAGLKDADCSMTPEQVHMAGTLWGLAVAPETVFDFFQNG